MTIKQAVMWLCQPGIVSMIHDPTTKEALSVAVKALAEPELGTDCISRQAAIDAIGEKSDEIYKTKQKGATYPHDDFFQGMAYAENVVKQLPPIQPEITHEQAIDYLHSTGWMQEHDRQMMLDGVHRLTAQPEIIYCKDCVKHNKGLGNYEVHPDGSTTWIWKDSACPLVSWRDKAQGHEFDYQFCAYAEKREVTE